MGEPVQLQIPTPDFLLIESSRSGLPAIVVVNSALESFAHREIFPWCLSILIEAKGVAERGMPTARKSEVLDNLGDHLEREVLETLTSKGATNALFIARLTWNGQRQLIYHAHDPVPIDKALREAIAAAISEREREYHMEEDSSWKQAGNFLHLIDTDGFHA